MGRNLQRIVRELTGAALSQFRPSVSRGFFKEEKLGRGVTSTPSKMMTCRGTRKCWYSLGNRSYYLVHPTVFIQSHKNAEYF